MGAARTILFFGLQPFLLAGWAALQFGQPITIESLASMLLLLCCLGMLSLENFKKKGHWELVGMGLALLGIILDAGGVVLSRWGLDLAPHVPVAEAQFFRSFGAVAGFVVMSFWVPLRLVPRMRTLSRRDRWMVLTASLAGTYVSLMFYLSAIKIGHLASVSSIAAAGPLFTSVVEHLYKREPPSRYFVAAITFFCLSFALVLAPEGLLLRLLESLGIFGT
jgi:drug/metabolite transporter (DMT)-like permease